MAIRSGFDSQKTRIQITSEWKDACIRQELEEVEKLEKFIQEERFRANAVAENLLRKQEVSDKRRQDLVELRKQQAIDRKERNNQAAAKAGFKVKELIQGDMAKYEEKQAFIKQKEKEREQERMAKNKAK
jgi:hypothetical protein